MKYTVLNDRLFDYVCEHRSGTVDPVLRDLRRETETLGDDARMQISEDQGSFLTILVAAIGARSAIEVGTFTGYSSICIARGLPTDGNLICIDESEEWTDIAKTYWKQAGVTDRIELQVGAALPLLDRLPSECQFEFAFIDADKEEYDQYYEQILPRVRKDGLLLFDNMLRNGTVLDDPLEDPNAKAIDALNKKLAGDSRVETVLLPIADGIQFCRKL